MNHIIETKGLSKKYGNVLRVKDVDLMVPEGAIYGFLGPNGAGKSTTLKMILGLAKPTAGEIKVFGKKVTGKNRLENLKAVGSLIESPSYYGHLTGAENLQIFQTLRGVPKKNIDEVLKIVRLDKQKDKKVNQYSLGMKQRLGFASALLGYPKLLILDEPTNGLDPAGIQEMRELIQLLPKKFGMTIVVSSHLLSEIDQLATQVGIIREGELVYQDSLTQLHQYSRKHLAVRTTNNDRAQLFLSQNRIAWETQEDYLIIPQLKDQAMAELSKALIENDVGMVRIEERKKSLEDIFLELTGTAVSL
ncbi:ABC transporter ATP-binding protein [Acetobacterium woodii]|uniref:ABC transport system ATP-binding protein n=1 Tax=Acetobacterium woodii (strain ATCC 29683 / DSM 1030 / JCM 2381 / KCTC 1655 / WB1) TaxID=931626 RepID=H6LEX8_ACEWD|nr:ABC transporter ATP-binding protein [Acetobacterium woodii]AFA46884.1 ABC transport system ATP-binding protein [Acetobacterium woodii DSM 1030]